MREEKKLEVLEQIKTINGPVKAAISVYYGNQNAKTATQVLSCLPNARLIVPAVLDNNVLTKEQSVHFRIVKDTEGKSYFAAFTDIVELHCYSKETAEKEEYLIMQFVEMVNTIEQSPAIAGFIINCKSQAFMLPRNTMIQMRNRLQAAIQRS